MSKLWSKGFNINNFVEEFTVGKDRELDLELARYDVLGSIAHIKMLKSIGLLKKTELNSLLKELNNILNIITKGEFIIEDGVEDVHSQVELMLTRSLGDIGKKIHSGRSRNDQILVDLKLYFKEEIVNIAESCKEYFNILIELSNKYKNVLMPGYTHLQIAMPSSFGLWFSAYAESITDDILVLEAAYKQANQNPLGSAAGYGSSFPLNRSMTTELLGFNNMHYNVIAAQMSRGKTERTLSFAISSIASTVGKHAMDVCLYTSQNFGFIGFPDEFTTGSSIMPHKKNPDVFELIRAKCNRLQSVSNELALMSTNLASGYNRDYQLFKDVLFPSIKTLKECLSMATLMLKHIIVNHNILDNNMYNYIFTVEDVNKMVLDGIPFRDAYKIVGEMVQNNTYTPNKNIKHTHEGSIGNLCNDKIVEKMNSRMAVFK